MTEGNLVLYCCYSLHSYEEPGEHIHRNKRSEELSSAEKEM